MCSWYTAGERATKGETCGDQMTDVFQAHKDVVQFLMQTRAMRSALVNRLYCAVRTVFMGVLSTGTGIFLVKISKSPSAAIGFDVVRAARPLAESISPNSKTMPAPVWSQLWTHHSDHSFAKIPNALKLGLDSNSSLSVSFVLGASGQNLRVVGMDT